MKVLGLLPACDASRLHGVLSTGSDPKLNGCVEQIERKDSNYPSSPIPESKFSRLGLPSDLEKGSPAPSPEIQAVC